MKQPKIYIAGRYSRRDELRAVAEQLYQELGLAFTSRWLYESTPQNSQMGDQSDEFYRETALNDLEDIRYADAVLFFAEDPLVGTPRGGRHVEFGYALAQYMPIYVIGPKENIFHHLPLGVKHFDTLADFTAFVRSQSNVAV